MLRLKVAKNSTDTPLGPGSMVECGICSQKIVEGEHIVHKRIVSHGHVTAHWGCLNEQAAELDMADYSDQLDHIAARINDTLEKTGDRVGRREILRAVIEGKFNRTDKEILAGVKGMMKELANG